MIQSISRLLLSVTLLADLVAVDKSYSQTVANWGPWVCGAQISIGLNTNLVKAGSTKTLYTWVHNGSTNAFRFDPNQSRPYVITNASGKTYMVTPIINYDLNIPNITVEPGQLREWSWTVTFGKDIGIGEYVFMPITRDITAAGGKVCTLTSNSIKVKVVKDN
jgi:hypothetical protein